MQDFLILRELKYGLDQRKDNKIHRFYDLLAIDVKRAGETYLLSENNCVTKCSVRGLKDIDCIALEPRTFMMLHLPPSKMPDAIVRKVLPVHLVETKPDNVLPNVLKMSCVKEKYTLRFESDHLCTSFEKMLADTKKEFLNEQLRALSFLFERKKEYNM